MRLFFCRIAFYFCFWVCAFDNIYVFVLFLFGFCFCAHQFYTIYYSITNVLWTSEKITNNDANTCTVLNDWAGQSVLVSPNTLCTPKCTVLQIVQMQSEHRQREQSWNMQRSVLHHQLTDHFEEVHWVLYGSNCPYACLDQADRHMSQQRSPQNRQEPNVPQTGAN